MIKRFCDKCGKEIEDHNYRVLSVSDPQGNVIFAAGEPVLNTNDRIELCMECIVKILKIIRENNND